MRAKAAGALNFAAIAGIRRATGRPAARTDVDPRGRALAARRLGVTNVSPTHCKQGEED
jgi:hypothetical protein